LSSATRGVHYRYVGEFALESCNTASHFALMLECGPGEVEPLPMLHFGIRAGAPNLRCV
jgi:hypothetical protein